MRGVVQNFDFENTKELGDAKLVKFSITKEEAHRINMRNVMSYVPSSEWITEGEYVKLYVDGTLMMSDTRMEKDTNREFINNAKGDVMIAGLGIGLILENLKDKVRDGVVKSITIYEKSKDVINLVSPYYKDLPITYKNEDILTYVPPKDEKYDTIYFDIWASISSDNLEDMRMLHNRWKFRKNKGGWMDSWRKKMCQYLARR